MYLIFHSTSAFSAGLPLHQFIFDNDIGIDKPVPELVPAVEVSPVQRLQSFPYQTWPDRRRPCPGLLVECTRVALRHRQTDRQTMYTLHIYT